MSNNTNGSSSAINELSRSRTRYKHQDQLLMGFYHMPDSTAKEVAAEYHDWKYELYGDSPKRATDLASDRLAYIELVGNRECRRSGKDAHIYRITQRGIEHLRKIGLLGVIDKPNRAFIAHISSNKSGLASVLAELNR